MTDYVKVLTNPTHTFERTDAERQVVQLRKNATVTDGVLRWISSGRVPFDDILALAVHVGLPVDLDKSRAARDTENAAFLREYAARQPAEPSAEERFEARAAHGPGVEIIDVVTGRKFTT